MSRKRYTPEQIIGKLREAEVALAQGETAGQVCRTLVIAEQTFYRWRREYGGLKVEQAKRLKVLEP
jgi:putative transposase